MIANNNIKKSNDRFLSTYTIKRLAKPLHEESYFSFRIKLHSDTYENKSIKTVMKQNVKLHHKVWKHKTNK